MIDIDNLLTIINNNKEQHKLYKLYIKNNPKIYGYIKDVEINNNIITFSYIDYFTDFDSTYKVENNKKSQCIIIDPDKMRGIFRGILTIHE